MKLFLIIGLTVCCSIFAVAKENSPKKTKVYQVWITHNGSQIVKGILYEVGDSSLFITESVNYPNPKEFHFSDVERLKVRREKSIGRGTVVGSAIGFASGTVVGAALLGSSSVESYVLLWPIPVISGLAYGVLGAGIGALTGTIKDRFPMKGNFENFEKYRGNLQDYSYMHEERAALHTFEHRGYVGFSMGLAQAGDEFASQVSVENYPGMRRTGFSSKTIIGYRFTERIGVNLSLRTNQYSMVEEDLAHMNWTLDAFTLGPVISFPLTERLRFDLSPSVGYASAYLWVENEEVYTGEGLGLNLTGALTYELSKRWAAMASAGYLSSKQVFKEGGKGTARDKDLQFILAYKFGKRSL